MWVGGALQESIAIHDVFCAAEDRAIYDVFCTLAQKGDIYSVFELSTGVNHSAEKGV